jgi:hypothetical protein
VDEGIGRKEVGVVVGDRLEEVGLGGVANMLLTVEVESISVVVEGTCADGMAEGAVLPKGMLGDKVDVVYVVGVWYVVSVIVVNICIVIVSIPVLLANGAAVAVNVVAVEHPALREGWVVAVAVKLPDVAESVRVADLGVFMFARGMEAVVTESEDGIKIVSVSLSKLSCAVARSKRLAAKSSPSSVAVVTRRLQLGTFLLSLPLTPMTITVAVLPQPWWITIPKAQCIETTELKVVEEVLESDRDSFCRFTLMTSCLEDSKPGAQNLYYVQRSWMRWRYSVVCRSKIKALQYCKV